MLGKRVETRLTLRGGVVIAIVIVFFIWLFFFSSLLRTECGQDKECFSKALEECKAAKFINIRDNNLYVYKVRGSSKQSCEVDIELKKMGVGTPLNLVNKFEGKSMKCFVPKDKISGDIDEIENVISYCSGPLKESILELIIDRLYGLLIKNVGEIIDQVDDQLYKIK